MKLLPALVLAAFVPSLGCSWLVVDEPPANHARLPYFDCTKSRVPPIVDTVFAAGSALSALALLDTEPSTERNSMIAVSAAWAAVWAFSASAGYQETADCRDALQSLQMRLATGGGRFDNARADDGPDCRRDRDCNGERVCRDGQCVEP